MTLRPASPGFTLIELLVVIAIILTITLAAAPTLRGPSLADLQDEETRRLAARMQYAHEQSMLFGQSWGLIVQADAYRFVIHNEDKWQPVTGRDALRTHVLPDGLQLQIHLDNHQLGDIQHDKPDGADDKPQILFLADGTMLPEYRIEMRAEGQSHDVSVITMGERQWIQLGRDGGNEPRTLASR